MKYYLKLNLLVILSFFFTFFINNKIVYADGFIVPIFPKDEIYKPLSEIPNLDVKYHRVNISIDQQIAKTTIDQVFKNNFHRDLEGTYIFPIPHEAVFDNFSMYMGKNKVNGKILGKDEARKIYEDIVRQRKDPALLEYMGRDMFKARIFPIPSKGESRIELSYSETLKQDSGIVSYRYVLDTERFSAKPLNELVISVKIKSIDPIKSVYSPSHKISVKKLDDYNVVASLEEKNVKPDKDFLLYYTVSKDRIGLNILSYKENNEDGYFLVMVSPKIKVENEKIMPKNIVFVLDTSGSMAGEKIEQAKKALEFCLNNLNPEDKFNIISFSDNVNKFKNKLVEANSKNIKQAIKYTHSMESKGGTDINSALKESLTQIKNKKDTNIIMFLTDGEPTVGITDNDEILKNIRKFNDKNSRIFIFGVGFDVNIQFLDKMALENHGTGEYVRPEESIEIKVSNLYSKVSHPILTNLKLDFNNINVSDVFPQQLPDIFKGSEITVFGRYKNSGKAKITLSGNIKGKQEKFQYNVNFNEYNKKYDFLPRLWASRKIGFLLDEIRLKGKINELVEEVIRLSKKYGIITEFTSFLVEEDVKIDEDIKTLKDKVMGKLKTASEVNKGSWAVSQSRNNQNLQQQTINAPNMYFDESGKQKIITQVQYVNNTAFYQRKNQWVDSNFSEKNPVIKIKQYSKAYFQLSKEFPEVNSYLALGDEVKFTLNGKTIEISVNDGKTEFTDKELKSLY